MELGHTLLVSADPGTIQQLSSALEELSISFDLCRDVGVAIGLLTLRKFDAVIVDLQLEEQPGLILDMARLSPSNHTAVTFAIRASHAESAAFRKRSEFVFERPLSAKSIEDTLKPAYERILRERRRYFRCPLAVPVVMVRQPRSEVRCNSVNVSEGGMALSTIVALRLGQKVRVQFMLPGYEIPFEAESKVCWWKAGNLGIRFLSPAQEHMSRLEGWLSRMLEERLPELVAGKVP